MIDLSHAHLGSFHAARGVSPLGSDYGPPGGSTVLRRAAAEWYGIDPQRLAVTTGASMALTCALATLPRPIRLLCPRPYYPNYLRLSALLNIELEFYDLRFADGWQPDLAAVAARASGCRSALLVNWPGNPTGALPERKTIELLRHLRDAHAMTIISDETYGDFAYGREAFSLEEWIGQRDVVAIKSGSKLFACPGERIGFVIAEPERLAEICHAHWTMALSPPASAQTLALSRLRSPLRAELDDLLLRLQEARNALADALRRSGLFDFLMPAGGTFLWVRLLLPDSEAKTFASACEDQGLRIAAGQAFGASESWFRISFAADAVTLRSAAERIVAAAEGVAIRA